MRRNNTEVEVPHPETGELISVDGTTLEEVASDGDFSEILKMI